MPDRIAEILQATEGHTPEPWVVEDVPDGRDVYGERDGNTVAHCPVRDVDVSLVRAAPELRAEIIRLHEEARNARSRIRALEDVALCARGYYDYPDRARRDALGLVLWQLDDALRQIAGEAPGE